MYTYALKMEKQCYIINDTQCKGKHSAKKRFVCLMKCSSGMLQKFVIFKDTKTHDFFRAFRIAALYFPNEFPDLSKFHIDQKTCYQYISSRLNLLFLKSATAHLSLNAVARRIQISCRAAYIKYTYAISIVTCEMNLKHVHFIIVKLFQC